MNLNKHWERISPIFEVFGLKNERWSLSKKELTMTHSWGAEKAPLSLLAFNKL
jgi:hypothetical protein